MLVALALTFVVSPAKAQQGRFEIRRTELVQTGYSTDVQVEFVVRSFTAVMFVRLRCELSDARGKSLGWYSQDFSSGLPYRPMNLPTGSFQRPTVHLHNVADADQASCGFATSDDPVPGVSTDDIAIVLDSIREVHITNRSGYQIDKAGFKCRGPELTKSYVAGGRLGWSPGYTSPRQPLQSVADDCTVLWATVSPILDPLN